MAGKDYLAMYLEMKTDLFEQTHFVPIMHFAENTARLARDIEKGEFYDNPVQVGMACERIRSRSPFQVSVLFFSTMPAVQKILGTNGIKEMGLMLTDIKERLDPSPGQGIPRSDLYTVAIKMGMKNRSTHKPKDFVNMHSDFNTGQFAIQFSHTKVDQTFAIIKNNFFHAMTFYDVRGQIFMNTGM